MKTKRKSDSQIMQILSQAMNQFIILHGDRLKDYV